MLNHYQILQISYSASTAEIKRAYRALARIYHPDKNSGPEATTRFQEIQIAYEVLADATKRSLYDRSLRVAAPATNVGKDQVYSVSQIHKQAEDLLQYIERSAGIGINYDALADFVLGILSKENIALMKRQTDFAENNRIIHKLLNASARINAVRSFSEIAGRMGELEYVLDAEVLERVQKELLQRQEKERQNKLVPYASMALVVLFILLMLVIILKKH